MRQIDRQVELVFCALAVVGFPVLTFYLGHAIASDESPSHTALIDAASVVAAFAGVVLLFLTLRANIAATREVAESNQIALGAQRPWLTLERFGYSADDGGPFVQVGAWFVNDGQSVATDVRLKIAWSTNMQSALRDLTEVHNEMSGAIAPTRSSLINILPLERQTLAANCLRVRVRAEYGWMRHEGRPFLFDGQYRIRLVMLNGQPQLRWETEGKTIAT